MRLPLVSQYLLVFISVLAVARTQTTAPANTTETTTSAPTNTTEMTTSAPTFTPETTTTTPQMTTPAPTFPPVMTTLTSPLSTSLTDLPFDPCYNYTVLDESWRSTDNQYANQPYSKWMCDGYVNWSGWYRFFIHGQSVPMAETCIAAGRCGTVISLWLNGAHPTVQDGVVSRGICSAMSNQCCSTQSTQIRVKACPGSYYVYELVKPSIGCDVAYCADARNFTITPVSTSAAPAIFYPFGAAAGDIINLADDDGSSSSITLLSPFLFFGRKYQQIYVNNNGYLTFDQASQDYVPYSFPGHGRRDIIAGLWTDLDNRRRGVISYHQYTSGSVLTRATQDINNHFPNLNFTASWVLVATWNKVAYYTLSNTVASFQVILISGGNFSFTLMNYGDIAGTENQVQSGYDTVYSTNYFAIPGSNSGSSISNLSTSSNVNVTGRWAFRVDDQPKPNKVFNFDPCYNYTVLDDPWRSTSTLFSSERLYDAYVNWIGWYRLFNQGTSVWMPDTCVPWLSCSSTMPMWLSGGHPSVEDGVVTRRLCGTFGNSDCCFYQSTQIRVKACPGGYYVYELVKPLPGYSAGYCTEARSQTPTTVFDQTAPAIFYPFGSAARDSRNPASDDGSSTVITMWSPFLFFGHTYQQIYVNNNGHLTFSQPSSQFVPYSIPTHGKQDIIAGLWTDLDNSVLGVVSYHQYTNGSVLTRATQEINNHFPNLTFNASYVFVATWNKVTYYRLTNTETSFQVVLISGSNYSFILMNYGDIAATDNPVEAGFDTVYSTDYFVIPGSNSGSSISNLKTSSNVNVTGRWAFRVDSGPNTYKSTLVGLKVELMSFLELTDSGNAQIVLQQMKQELVKHGLPSDANLKFRKLQKIKP